MARRSKQGDDPSWNEPAIGGDPDAPSRPPGSRYDYGRVSRLGEAFWRECDLVPLSIPRWSSRPKMNANIMFMLRNDDEKTIEASFHFFRSESEGLTLVGSSCWDVYFRRRGSYLRSARRTSEGRRPGETVRTAGDLRVDNDRFRTPDQPR
jgi:hypothetical protein